MNQIGKHILFSNIKNESRVSPILEVEISNQNFSLKTILQANLSTKNVRQRQSGEKVLEKFVCDDSKHSTIRASLGRI